MKYKVRFCRLADQEHQESTRQYAHTFHIKNRICLAHAFSELPLRIQVGILMHELGHLFDYSISELDVDEFIKWRSGIPILREGKQKLESVPRDRLFDAAAYVRRYTDLP